MVQPRSTLNQLPRGSCVTTAPRAQPTDLANYPTTPIAHTAKATATDACQIFLFLFLLHLITNSHPARHSQASLIELTRPPSHFPARSAGCRPSRPISLPLISTYFSDLCGGGPDRDRCSLAGWLFQSRLRTPSDLALQTPKPGGGRLGWSCVEGRASGEVHTVRTMAGREAGRYLRASCRLYLGEWRSFLYLCAE
jgi:hypothetical protein